MYVNVDRIFVRLGEHGITGDGPQDYYIESVMVHEHYVAAGSRNDIAIIRLPEWVSFTSWFLINTSMSSINLTHLLLYHVVCSVIIVNEWMDLRGYSADLFTNRQASTLNQFAQHFSVCCRLGFDFILYEYLITD